MHHCRLLSLHFFVAETIETIMKLCEGNLHALVYEWGLTFQLLPLLYLIKPHNAPLSKKKKKTGFDLHICYFYFSFNRKLFIQHINHKILQHVRLYHATVIKLHCVIGRLGLLPFDDLP